MKRFLGGGWALVFAVVLIGLLPGFAEARQGYFTSPPLHFREFELPASNGYRIQVTDIGRRSIYLTAKNSAASVTYVVRGKRTDQDGIEARFPGVGRISVRFDPVGRPHREPPAGNCKGDDSVIRHGVFRGAIVFNGEKGFAKARASHASGEVFDSAKEVCRRQKEGGGGPSFHSTSLIASARRDKGVLYFFAIQFSSDSLPVPDLTSYSATLAQSRGQMSVSHSISQDAPNESFAVSGPSARPTAASIAPPAPFVGSASFQLEPGSTASWTGALTADLPGFGPVGLAGPKFSAELCRDNRCAGSSKGSDTVIAAFGRRGTPTAAAPSPRPWPR
jgi:hypothetical protein